MKRKSTGAVSAEIYIFNGKRVQISNSFVYEVTLYKQTKNCYSLASSKMFKSKELLKYSHRCEAVYGDGKLIKFVDLISAPKDFLVQNGKLLTFNESNRELRKGRKKGRSRR